MSDKRSDDGDHDRDDVLTPGGPRPRNLVHGVGAGQAVRFGEAGARVVARDDPNTVLTPGGFRHRSLVHRVEAGQALRTADGAVHRIDRETKKTISVHAAAADLATVPALGSGWIAYAYWNNGTGNSITSFTTTWTVPPVPVSQDGQTIFLFNGIQNYGNNFGILQPVLQYGGSAAGGGAYWSVANWYVTSGGNAFYTPLVQVNANDTLVGVMSLTGSSGGTFDYESAFQGIGATLPVLNIAELLWCNETLEAYSVAQCSDYPAGATAFTAIGIQTGGTTPVLNWTPVNQVTDCGQSATVASNANPGGEVDITY